MKQALQAHKVVLKRVTVWESDNASASYFEEDCHD
jgi:hypothetical protein